MKRLALLATFAFALLAAFAISAPGAHARPQAASPSPSPTPASSALPAATPEPPEIAIPRLEGVLKANPKNVDAQQQLAMQFLQINRPDLAVQLTQNLLKTGNKTAPIYYFDGAAMMALNQLQQATSDFEAASTLDPTNEGVLAQLSNLYLKENRPNDAERVAKRAITFNKTSTDAIMNLGLVYANESHYDDARVQFEQAATLAPKDTQPIVQIANTYASQDNIPMALTTLNRALAIDPKNVQILVFKADLYAKQHDDANVGPAYDDAVVAATTDDQRVDILLRKAGYYADSKKNDQVSAILNQVVTTYPKVAAAHTALGSFDAQNNQLGQAEAQWQAALAIDKDYGPALMALGEDKLGAKKYNDAIGYLKHYTAVNPSDAQGFFLLGQAYAYVQDFKRSHDACGMSLRIQTATDPLTCLAVADYELKNYVEGGKIFDYLGLNVQGYFGQQPTMLYFAAKCWAGANQKTKAIGALKALLPLTKKGSADYKRLSGEIAALTAKTPPPKKKT